MIICQSNSRHVGYASVSTTDQELCLQIDALRQHGVKKEHLFCDKISGAKDDIPGLFNNSSQPPSFWRPAKKDRFFYPVVQ